MQGLVVRKIVGTTFAFRYNVVYLPAEETVSSTIIGKPNGVAIFIETPLHWIADPSL